jgi:hypothetical protein
MKTELIKEFEEKHQRCRFLQDTGIGDMHSEQGSYCNEYVEFLEQKLANGVEQSESNCNIPHVSDRLSFKDIGELADKWLEDEIALSVEDRFTAMEKYWMIEGFMEGYKKAQNGC